jgi:hypothetical protein
VKWSLGKFIGWRAEKLEPIKPQSNAHEFSVRPGLHYFLTICFMTLIVDVHAGANVYSCLSIGNDAYCTSDIGRLKELGVFEIPSPVSLILPVLLNALMPNIVLWPIVLILCTPIFLMAAYISWRFRIRRNFAGIIFWIMAWILAVLGFPLFCAALGLFDHGHVSWHADVIFLLEAGGMGIACGIVFCLLTFQSRSEPAQS